MPEKKHPGWVIAIGIAGIMISFAGIYSGGAGIFLPGIIDLQMKLLPELMEKMAGIMPREAGRAPEFPKEQMKKMTGAMLSKLMGEKPWFKSWLLYSGLALLLISSFYLFSSIMFLQLKPAGPGLLCASLVASVMLSLTGVVVLVFSGAMIGLTLALGSIISAAINGVLLLVVIFSDKKVFSAK